MDGLTSKLPSYQSQSSVIEAAMTERDCQIDEGRQNGSLQIKFTVCDTEKARGREGGERGQAATTLPGCRDPELGSGFWSGDMQGTGLWRGS